MVYRIMEGSVRVFAGEFSQSTLVIPSDDSGSPGWVVSPGGAFCRQIYLAGALTEVSESGGMLRCRVADPTGAFEIVSSGKNAPLVQAVENIPVPSFVAVSGSAQMYQKNSRYYRSVRMEQVMVIDRAMRDQILLTTAEYSLCRLEHLRSALAGECTDEQMKKVISHYMPTVQSIGELARMVEGAVQSTRSQEPESPMPDIEGIRLAVCKFLQEVKGPRGISVEEILADLVLKGSRKEDVLSAIEALIVDDECYQPQKGYIKLL